MPLAKKYQLVTEPTGLVVTVAQCKEQLVLDHNLDNDLIEDKIRAAQRIWQQRHGRQLLQHSFKAYYAMAYSELSFRAFPLTSVNAVKYRDAAGNTQTLVENTDYYVDQFSRYPTIELNTSYLTDEQPNPVWVEYTTGYGNSGDNEAAQIAAVPAEVKEALLVMVAGMFENRENPYVPTVYRVTAADALTYHLRTEW